MCVSKGMVRGKRQAVDSVFIKANASMDSLVEKEVLEDASAFVNEFEENSEYKVTSTRKKNFTPQLFVSVNLLDMVPSDNFYRKLLTELDLHFIYKATQKYYGNEGQQSIDPVVFFKILLVGYLNNINSDRQLSAFCSDSLSIRLFFG